MKILVAPDKFKDALGAPEVTEAIAAGIHDALPGAEIDRCPLGDGGDGSGAIIAQALGGEPRKTTVTDPLGRPIAAPRGMSMSFCVSIWTSSTSKGMYLSASNLIALRRSSSDILARLM